MCVTLHDNMYSLIYLTILKTIKIIDCLRVHICLYMLHKNTNKVKHILSTTCIRLCLVTPQPTHSKADTAYPPH